jgi:hypothetical protein
MMTMCWAQTRRVVRFGGVLAMMLAMLGVVASAQTSGTPDAPIKVESGKEIKVTSGEAAITVTTAPKNGTTRVDAAVAPAKTSTLFYKANETATAATDSLTYKIGTEADRTVKIEIAAKPIESTVSPGPRPAISGFNDKTYEQGFKALFLIFVLAVILESGLAVLFNWRPFVEKFNARAVRPLVSFVAAYIIVFMFDLDILTTMVNAINASQVDASQVPGRLLTALVIAGGSAGVNSLMVALGFRQVRTPENAVPKPVIDEGWISVSINRKKAVGPVTVSIGEQADGHTPVVTLIKETSRPKSFFFHNPGRFPGSGGYSVKAGSVVTVVVTAAANSADKTITTTWGPNRIAQRAIIDLEFDV